MSMQGDRLFDEAYIFGLFAEFLRRRFHGRTAPASKCARQLALLIVISATNANDDISRFIICFMPRTTLVYRAATI